MVVNKFNKAFQKVSVLEKYFFNPWKQTFYIAIYSNQREMAKFRDSFGQAIAKNKFQQMYVNIQPIDHKPTQNL